MPAEKIIIFRISEQVFGMNIESVSAIEAILPIREIPNAPINMEGVIQLRGTVIPVYNVRKKFRLDRKDCESTGQLIITRCEGESFAFVVDSVDEIKEVQSELFFQAPNVVQTEETSYIDGIVNVNNQLVICLDAKRLMSDSEKESLQSMIDYVTM